MHMPRNTMIRRLFLGITVVLAGCSAQPQPKDCGRAPVFCVGLVTDFGGVDTGINHEAWLALQDALAAGMAQRVDVIETVDVRDRAANIAAFADQGYDVVVTIGSSMADATAAAASKYPKSAFIGVEQPQDKLLPNLVSLAFHEEQSGFLAGALAALFSQTDRVAAICDAKFVDAMRRYCDGFVAGARYARPDINATATYRDGPNNRLFNDPEWGHAAALAEVQSGADVVFAAGGNTARAALETAAAQGTYAIGTETDLYGELANVRPMLLTSAVNETRVGVLDLLRKTHDGAFPPGEYMGEVGLAPWHDLDSQIPEAVKQELDKIRVRLAAGMISIDVPYKAP